MIKKFVATVLLSTGLVAGTMTQKNKEFTYEYSVVLNSNSMSDLLDGYTYKEYLIDEYNVLVTFANKILSEDLPIDPEIQNIIDEHFWDML